MKNEKIFYLLTYKTKMSLPNGSHVRISKIINYIQIEQDGILQIDENGEWVILCSGQPLKIERIPYYRWIQQGIRGSAMIVPLKTKQRKYTGDQVVERAMSQLNLTSDELVEKFGERGQEFASWCVTGEQVKTTEVIVKDSLTDFSGKVLLFTLTGLISGYLIYRYTKKKLRE